MEELVAEGCAGVEGALALAGGVFELARDCQGEREYVVDCGGDVAPEADGEHGDAGPGVAVTEVEEGEGEERGEEGDEQTEAEDREGVVDGEDVDVEDDEAVVEGDAGPAAGLNGLVVAPEGVFEDADDGVEDVVGDVGAEADRLLRLPAVWNTLAGWGSMPVVLFPGMAGHSCPMIKHAHGRSLVSYDKTCAWNHVPKNPPVIPTRQFITETVTAKWPMTQYLLA